MLYVLNLQARTPPDLVDGELGKPSDLSVALCSVCCSSFSIIAC